MNETLLKDLMNENSIYYQLLIDIYDTNRSMPLKKEPGRELHHKVPKFYFKMNNMEIDNSDSNLVSLSKKDHFLAHYYIWRGANEKYCGKAAAPVNFMLKYITKGISTSNITDEDIIYIEKLMKNGSGNLCVKGTHWYNNGKVCIMAKECPEGFIPGRINHKEYAEIKLLEKQERRKAANLENSIKGKKLQKQKAEEYFEENLKDFSEDYRKFALDIWEMHLHTSSQIVTMLTFLREETKKDKAFFEKLKYTLLHLDEYELLYKDVTQQKRNECQKVAFEKMKIERKEQRDKIIEKIITENPNHSIFWYKEFVKGDWRERYFKVSLAENKHLLSIAYQHYPHSLGYTDFRNFFSLNKLSIIKYLEKNGYITLENMKRRSMD